MRGHQHGQISLCIYIYMNMYIDTCIYIYTDIQRLWQHRYICICWCTPPICLSKKQNIYIYISIYICRYICSTYTYTYIYIYCYL